MSRYRTDPIADQLRRGAQPQYIGGVVSSGIGDTVDVIANDGTFYTGVQCTGGVATGVAVLLQIIGQRVIALTAGNASGQSVAAGYNAGYSGSVALTAHNLNDTSVHLGQLATTQATWALNKTGGDTITGNVAVSPGVTIDGVDISALSSQSLGAPFITYSASTDLTNERVITPNTTLVADTATPGIYGLALNLNSANVWTASQTWGAGFKVTDGQQMTGTTVFASGFAGDGWRVIDTGSKSQAEFDELIIRGTMRVYELLITKIRALAGNLLISPGNGKVQAVSGTGPYTITFDNDHYMAVGDLLKAQKFGTALGGVYVSELQVASIPTATQITATLISGVAPAIGYEYVMLGSATDAARRASIYFSTSDTNSPRINLFDGVSSHAGFGATANVRGAWGRMNSYYGAGATNWGFGIGDYAGNNYLRYADDATGFQLKAAAGGVKIDGTGVFVTVGNSSPAIINGYNMTSAVAGLQFFGMYAHDIGATEQQLHLRSHNSGNVVTSVTIRAASASLSGQVALEAFSSTTSELASIIVDQAGSVRIQSAPAGFIVQTGVEMEIKENLAVVKGINVGTATGAVTGQVKASSGLSAHSTQPYLDLYETDASTDNKRWDITAAGEQLLFRALNDAYSAGVSFMTVDRTAHTAIDKVNFPQSSINVGTASGTGLGFAYLKNTASIGGPQLAFQTSGTGTPDWRVGIPGSVNSEDFFIYDNSGGGAGESLRIGRGVGRVQIPYGAQLPRTPAATERFAIDIASHGTAITLANGASTKIFTSGASSNFGGMIVIQETSTDGSIAMYLTGSAAMALVSDPSGTYAASDTAGKSCVYLDGSNIVMLKNNRGGNRTYHVFALRTRTSN